MRTVKVERKDLLKKVESNAKTHKKDFETALEGYRIEAVEKLEEQLSHAKNGMTFNTVIHLPVPEDHTADYQRVITMLQMSVDDEIELSSQDFDQFVMDNWSWKAMFGATSALYSAKVLK